MAVEQEFLTHILELFADLGTVRTGRMFGGVGLFVEDDVMFAMISSTGTVYLKSDETTLPQFQDAGSEAFWYMRGEKRMELQTFMTLPESALDDPDEAIFWANLALSPARVAAEQKRKQKARKKKQ
ncbi:MAG: TfoX/Sxy family protein [Thalassovita sp.]